MEEAGCSVAASKLPENVPASQGTETESDLENKSKVIENKDVADEINSKVNKNEDVRIETVSKKMKARKISETECEADETKSKKNKTECQMKETENKLYEKEIASKVTETEDEVDNAISVEIIAHDETKIEEQVTRERKDEVKSKFDETKNEELVTEKDKIKLKTEEIEKKEEIVRLGYNTDEEDDDEDMEIFTGEEVRSYLLQKISEYMRDPAVNPLLALKNQAYDLQENMRDTRDDYIKIKKTFELMYQDHEKFLRHLNILPKIPTRSIQVQVDMPVLVDDLPPKSSDGTPTQMDSGAVTILTPSQSQVSSINNALTAGARVPALPSSSSATKPPSNTAVECIDLTDDVDSTVNSGSGVASCSTSNSQLKHPAPLPPIPCQQLNKIAFPPPPKPQLKIATDKFGIVLQWDLPRDYYYAKLSNFEIFGYQEQKNIPVSSALWKKIGSVRAMLLPMACTLTQFVGGYRYHFSIRAVDNFGRYGSYSDPGSVMFVPCTTSRIVKTEFV